MQPETNMLAVFNEGLCHGDTWGNGDWVPIHS